MTPTEEAREDLLLSCRFGDLDDVQSFVASFPDVLDDVQDDNGNTVLHMVAANGHIDVLDYLLPLVSPRLLTHQNHAGSTPLHWAAINRHLHIVQALVRHPTGPGIDMIGIKNEAGRSPLAESEMVGWDEGARWFVQVMKLDDGVTESEADPSSQAIEVEIQDAGWSGGQNGSPS